MSLFAGNLVFEGKRQFQVQDFETLTVHTKTGDTLLFVLGDIETDVEEELVLFLKETFGDWKYIDVSFSAVDEIELLVESYEEGTYEIVSFEGENVEFDEICDRFADADGAILVREAETSKIHGNKIVKVEFIY